MPRNPKVYTSRYNKVRIFKVVGASTKSKKWVADPANRVCDAPGSWYCPGQYPPALNKIFEKRRAFKQLEDFNIKRDAKDEAHYTEYMRRMGGGGDSGAERPSGYSADDYDDEDDEDEDDEEEDDEDDDEEVGDDEDDEYGMDEVRDQSSNSNRSNRRSIDRTVDSLPPIPRHTNTTTTHRAHTRTPANAHNTQPALQFPLRRIAEAVEGRGGADARSRRRARGI